MDVGAGLYMYDVVVKKFTFAISSPGEFLYKWFLANVNSRSRSLYAIARPSVVCTRMSSVTFVRSTQAVQIFGNISTTLGTSAIR